MATQAQTPAGSEQEQVVEQKIQQLRELYADAPEMGKSALENVLSEGCSQRWRAANAAWTRAPAGSASVRARSRSSP